MIAYLIAAHAEPDLVLHLVQALRSPVSASFIHIDGKVDLAPFEGLRNEGARLIERRVKVYWGGWSQVQASLNLIEAALNDERRFEYFVLLSGVDYPLVRSEVLLDYLRLTDVEGINCLPMPAAAVDKPISRLTIRRLEGRERQHGPRAALIGLVNRLLRLLPPRNLDRALGDLRPHCGSNWWVLSRAMVEQALAISRTPQAAAFKASLCPDEDFFQTVVASRTPAERIGRAFTYTDWSTPNPPAVLDDRHFDLITAPGFRLDGPYGEAPCLFARKMPSGRPDLRQAFDDFAAARTLDPIADRSHGAMKSR